MNTNWSTPNRNFFAGINNLRKALASNYNARLVKANNEDCEYPIKEKNYNLNFKNYEFNYGTSKTRQDIIDDKLMSDFDKYLTLNYITCYGTQEAKDTYYKTGLLSKDNDKGVGVSHLIKVSDLVAFLYSINETNRAKTLKEQYLTLETSGENHFYDFYTLQSGSEYVPKKFKNKVWVVELLDDDKPKTKIPFLVHVFNVLSYPLKYVPQKSVLNMDDYKCVTYRIGDVVNGYSLEFHIPKKFNF
jgi:hypothetical protein